MNGSEIVRQQNRSRTVNSVSMLFIIGIMVIVGLGLITGGIQVYKNIVISAEQNYELRTSLSYVATKVRSADSAGMLENDEVGNILALYEPFEGEDYVTYIFYKDGFLCECMQEEGEEPDTEGAVEVMEIGSFIMDFDGRLLTLTSSNRGTDETEALTRRTETLSLVLRQWPEMG